MPSRCRRVRDRRPIHKSALTSTRFLEDLSGDLIAVDLSLSKAERDLADHAARLIVLEKDGGGSSLVQQDVPCLSTVVVGDVGMFSGGTLVRADPLNIPSLPAVGVVVAKPTATTATIQVALLLRGVYSGLTAGRRYFVGLDGRPTITAPVATVAGTPVAQQEIGVAISATVLRVSPSSYIFIDQI